ncbi:MAG: hypothetical protein PHT25_10875 [Bacteroidales bacterium]|nr:hypothetical protein [Bacteroidales bacterium]
MKKIKVFLASSIGEMKMDRLAISEATLELNDELVDNDIRLQLFMCEHHDTAIAISGKQNEYNDFIRSPCDLFINLYFSKIGSYTFEEYQTALETKRVNGLPLIYVFTKTSNNQTSEQLKDFCERLELDGVEAQYYSTLDEVTDLYRQAVYSYIKLINLS